MFAATTLAMLVANTLAAPVSVNMGDLLESEEAVGKDGKHSLYFYYINEDQATGPPANNPARCGEVDAGPRMPQELFELKNIARLSLYVSLTIEFYGSLGMNGNKLKLGRCKTHGYPVTHGGAMQGINWVTDSLMGPICLKQCDCNYNLVSGPSGNPFDRSAPNGLCKQDQPDDPSAGKFCSLCSPPVGQDGYNSYATINFWGPIMPDDDTWNDDDGTVYDNNNCAGQKKRSCNKSPGCGYNKKDKACRSDDYNKRHAEE